MTPAYAADSYIPSSYISDAILVPKHRCEGCGQEVTELRAVASAKRIRNLCGECRTKPPRRAKPAKPAARAGRNAPCPCGSQKKYKKCCGANS
jgi:uncharacterized protein YecA (UPF0149 family)